MATDLRIACRNVLRRPLFSAVAVLALAIGMAVNTVAFSAVNALLFKKRAGFDVEGAGRILVSGSTATGEGLSLPEAERLADATRGALITSVEGRTSLAWRHEGRTDTIWALLVSSSYFDILEARTTAGRLFTANDVQAASAAVISERFWRERLQTVSLDSARLNVNGVEVAVIGILPDSFEGPGGLYAPEVWLPFESRRLLSIPPTLDREDQRWLAMFGRLAGQTSPAEANARLRAGATQIARDYPRTHNRYAARYALMHERVSEIQSLRWAVAAGMSAVGIVLLLACFNVATLQLARAVERQREMGIRVAIGASRWQILRQQIAEGLVLSIMAGLVALVIAWWSQSLLGAFAIPVPSPQRLNVTPDATVLAFISLMVIVGGLLPALAPAVGALRLDIVRQLTAQGHTGSGGRPSPARQGLVLLQVAGSTAFLSVAALFVQSFVWSGHADPGFDSERAVVLTIDAASQGLEPERARASIDRIVERLRALPGVERVTRADRIPFAMGYPRTTEIARGKQPCETGGCSKVLTYAVEPNHFEAMGIPLSGRTISTGNALEVVVSEVLAAEWFPAGGAIGQVLRIGDTNESRTIVGVARDTRAYGFSERQPPVLYRSLALPDFANSVTIVVRTASNPAPLVQTVAETVHEVDPRLAAESVETMSARLQLPRWPMRAASGFFGICGALALLLATIGLAAVISHAVTQRQREFGVRLAVGATPANLVVGVLTDSLRVVVPGIVLGLAGGLGMTQFVGAALVGISSTDSLTYAAIAAVQMVIAVVACILPARRAATVDPVAVLRAD